MLVSTSVEALQLLRVTLDTPSMRDISVEQRYRAVQSVVGDGRTVTDVAGEWKVSRQTLHAWLGRYEADGLDGLSDRSHRPVVPRPERDGEEWVARKVAANGLVCVDWQQVSVGKHFGGNACNVLVSDRTLQFWVGGELLKTVARRRSTPVRKKRAEGTSPRAR
jgi:transposase-like protein